MGNRATGIAVEDQTAELFNTTGERKFAFYFDVTAEIARRVMRNNLVLRFQKREMIAHEIERKVRVKKRAIARDDELPQYSRACQRSSEA